jgi:hypothetical protein
VIKLSDLAVEPPPASTGPIVDIAEMVAQPGFAPKAWQSAAPDTCWQTSKAAVPGSPDLTRVMRLPRRPVPEAGSARADALARVVTARYARPNDSCRCASMKRSCITTLNRVQAWALHEIATAGGLLGNIAVGSGKCHAAGTEFFDYSTGRRRDVSEPGPVAVAAFDRVLQVTDGAAFPSGHKECVRVALADGCAATPSTDHPYLTHRGWVHAAELRIGDFVAVATEMPEPGLPTRATNVEVALVAYLLSDGGCTAGNLNFTNATPAVLVDFEQCAGAVGYEVTDAGSRSQATTWRLIGGKRRRLLGDRRLFLPDTWRDRWDLHGLAKEKRAHADLWGLPREQVALFLNRFWSCDGHVSAKALECTLASEKLIDDLRFLLLRLGVRSRKHSKRASYMKDGIRHTFPAWRITITGAAAVRFLATVGNVLGKESACETLRAKLQATKRNTNFDVVPVGYPELHEICDELGYPRRGSGTRTGNGKAGRTALMRGFFRTTPGQFVPRSKFVEFCAAWGYRGKYAHLATTGVAWERVVSIEPAGVQPVYDLSVPGPRNFVANGMIVHNTALDILAALAMPGCRLALLLVPPNLVDQLVGEYELMSQHFRVPSIQVHGRGYRAVSPGEPVLHVLAYSRLSRPEATAFLEQLRPDTVIADETHRLRHPDGAGCARVLRYFNDHRDTRFCGWTGSMTDSTPRDYAHLSAMALRGGSPLPLEPEVTDDWARALDPTTDHPAPPGALMGLCEEGEHLYSGFRRRLVETLGIVATTEAAIDAELEISERPAPEIPHSIRAMLDDLRGCAVRPDGEELVTPLEISKTAHELACGLYLRWIYPRGEPENVIDEWFEARKEWRKELRLKLRDRREHLDSPMLCALAAMRHHGQLANHGDLPEWDSETWVRWHRVKPTVKPETQAVRVDDYLARDAAAWAQQERGIVWYSTVAFGEWVAEISGLPLHGGGPGAGERIGRERGDRSIVASIKSHGTGRDGLQRIFDRQLIASPPTSATEWEQCLGRLYRIGQHATKIHAWYYGHTPELAANVEEALSRAEYVYGTWGSSQKLRTSLRRPE